MLAWLFNVFINIFRGEGWENTEQRFESCKGFELYMFLCFIYADDVVVIAKNKLDVVTSAFVVVLAMHVECKWC